MPTKKNENQPVISKETDFVVSETKLTENNIRNDIRFGNEELGKRIYQNGVAINKVASMQKILIGGLGIGTLLAGGIYINNTLRAARAGAKAGWEDAGVDDMI